MHHFSSLVIVILPLLPMAAALTTRSASGPRAGQIIGSAAWSVLFVVLIATGILISGGPFSVHLPVASLSNSGFSLFRFDNLAAVMAGLVAVVSAVIIRFSRKALAGDPRQSAFLAGIAFAMSAVQTLVLAGNLLVFLAAWVATSLCVHRLLLHYPERVGARLAARKKFLFGRLGDLLLLAAIIRLRQDYGTFEIETILAQIGSPSPHPGHGTALLLAGCALLKSAQFPFHSWLPDTMEAPTPVSAFMHAGIINAGGFLVIRLAPVFGSAPYASNLVALVGAATAAYGAIVMLAQPTVKRALAYSTIAQMGFMFLECGLGAYSLALLHIVAHSLYKVHAFLTSGSTIGTAPRTAVPLPTPAVTISLAVGAGIMVASGALQRWIFPAHSNSSFIFPLIVSLAVAYGLARTLSVATNRRTVVTSSFTALILSCLSGGLHVVSEMLLPSLRPPAVSPWLTILIVALFAGLFFFQVLLWRAHRSTLGRRIYVHALNGFYVSTIFNRWLSRFSPTSV